MDSAALYGAAPPSRQSAYVANVPGEAVELHHREVVRYERAALAEPSLCDRVSRFGPESAATQQRCVPFRLERLEERQLARDAKSVERQVYLTALAGMRERVCNGPCALVADVAQVKA